MTRNPFRARDARPALDEFDDAPVGDFVDDVCEARPLVRRGVAAMMVSLLGLGVIAGVSTAASAYSTEQAAKSVVVDKFAPDKKKAAPQNTTLSVEQQAAIAAAQANKNASQGQLNNAFGGRGSTTSRTTARGLLGKAVTSVNADERGLTITSNGNQVIVNANNVAMDQRDEQLDADLKKVKANAAKIAAEKKAAAERLKKAQEAAKAAQDKQAKGQPLTPEEQKNLGAALANAAGGVSAGGGALPLAPGTFHIGAHFGQYGSWARWHTGQDLVAACGTPVYAAAAGIVGSQPSAGWAGPNVLAIHHANGGSTLYAHMSSRVVSSGQMVKAGQLVGYVGNMGRSFGCHLHFEYYPPGTTPGDVYSASDPISFLRSLGVRI